MKTIARWAVSGLLLAITSCSNGSPTVTATGCVEECGFGRTCASGRCTPIACEQTAACPASLTCIGGFCTDQSCEPSCSAAQVCLATLCVPLEPTTCTTTQGCASPETCVGGYCVDDDCTPACTSGDVCLSGVCVPPSSSCGASYQACLQASGAVCVNLERDPQNCGSCGNACPAGQVCNGAGQCASVCAEGQTVCGGDCVDVRTSATNCGGCDQACAAGQTCAGGTCAASCGLPLLSCGAGASAICVDPKTDPNNCGGCGLVCPGGAPCVGGVCGGSGCPGQQTLCDVDGDGGSAFCATLGSDPDNCGSCGFACAIGQSCQGGSCISPGCSTAETRCGLDGGGSYCADLATDPDNCGACGAACASTCCSGSCVDPSTDLQNCGGCGSVCAGGIAPPECALGRCLRTLAVVDGGVNVFGFGELAVSGGRVFWGNAYSPATVFVVDDAGQRVFWSAEDQLTQLLAADALYVLYDGDVWALSFDGGAAQQVTTNLGSVWQFAYTSAGILSVAGPLPSNGLNSAIFLTQWDGGVVLVADGGDEAFDWVASDGDRVAWQDLGAQTIVFAALDAGGIVPSAQVPLVGCEGAPGFPVAEGPIPVQGWLTSSAALVPCVLAANYASEYLVVQPDGGLGFTDDGQQLYPAPSTADQQAFYYADTGAVWAYNLATAQSELLYVLPPYYDTSEGGSAQAIESLAVDATSLYIGNIIDGTLKQLTPK